ncbi:MAG: translesion DNA synthesis-associated protein ImuA [Betaproteobacteria bacterium]|nr:translesion DNA synthesis-associated protein ImuA [Betaproteobacteria bacterium]
MSMHSLSPDFLRSPAPVHPALWRGADLARTAAPGVPSGFPVLDAELPGGGWPVGSLTEILRTQEGIGELRILGPALAALSAQGRHLAWIAPPYSPYAPALAAAGIDPGQLFVVRTGNEKEALWAIEQALRSNACGAVLAWLQSPRYAELRRLQLAAEGGGRALAVLFRPEKAAAEPSPAVLRIALGAAAGGLAVRIVKRRGAPLDRLILLPAVAPQRLPEKPPGTAGVRQAPAKISIAC